MKFLEAYELMRKGKQVMREAWKHEDDGSFCMMIKKMPQIWKILYKPNASAGNWMATREEINAEDWIEVEAMGDEIPAIMDVSEVV